MKKLIALTLALIMVFALASTSVASAATAQYSTTQEFMNYCDQNGIKYEYVGMGTTASGQATGRETVRTQWRGNNFDSISVTLAFDQSLDTARLYSWNIINYNSYNYSSMLEVVNNLNAKFFWVKFYCDTSDDSVSGEMSIPLRQGVAGELAVDALYAMVSIIDDAGEYLTPYAK